MARLRAIGLGGAALVVVAGCGRLGFGERADAGDAAIDAFTGDPSLVLHLEFDGADLRRDTGAAPHVVTCGSCPTSVAGRVGAGAAQFDGTQCLAIADAADLRPAQFTVAAWLRPDPVVTQNANPIARPFDGATTNTNTWEVVYDSGSTSVVAAVDSVVLGGGVAAGWQHFAITCDGTSYTLYLAGVAAGTVAITTLPYADDPLRVGCDFNSGAEATPYTGAIDDVRFYDRVLTASEVQALAAM